MNDATTQPVGHWDNSSNTLKRQARCAPSNEPCRGGSFQWPEITECPGSRMICLLPGWPCNPKAFSNSLVRRPQIVGLIVGSPYSQHKKVERMWDKKGQALGQRQGTTTGPPGNICLESWKLLKPSWRIEHHKSLHRPHIFTFDAAEPTWNCYLTISAATMGIKCG